MIVNGFSQRRDLVSSQSIWVDTLAFTGIARNRQPIALLGTHRLQRIQAQHHGAQSCSLSEGLAMARAAFKAKLGNQPRIDPVGLGANQVGCANALICAGLITLTINSCAAARYSATAFPKNKLHCTCACLMASIATRSLK